MAKKEVKRERSVAYPYASWSDCLDFIKQIDSFKASQVSYDEAARKWGVSVQAPSFKAKLSASRQFGLIETSGNVISLSSYAKKLLYPTGNDEPQITLECFANPPLYSKLIGVYNGKALPTETVLSNVMMNDYAIARNAKDAAAKFFVTNATEMGFVRAGVLDYSLNEDAKNKNYSFEIMTEVIDEKSPLVKSDYDVKPIVKTFSENENDYITQIIPTESGKVARMMIPLDVTEDDLWLIRDTLDLVMKRKFRINVD